MQAPCISAPYIRIRLHVCVTQIKKTALSKDAVGEQKMSIFTTNHTNSYLRCAHEHEDLLFKNECYKINGIYAINRKLGSGFLKAVYQEALEIEFKRQSIPFISQHELEILYDGIPLKNKYIADIVCYEKIIIELKAVSKINNQHKAQLINYMSASGFKLGLLVNFNSYPKAEIIRMVK